jgi:hypothetical protein
MRSLRVRLRPHFPRAGTTQVRLAYAYEVARQQLGPDRSKPAARNARSARALPSDTATKSACPAIQAASTSRGRVRPPSGRILGQANQVALIPVDADITAHAPGKDKMQG